MSKYTWTHTIEVEAKDQAEAEARVKAQLRDQFRYHFPIDDVYTAADNLTGMGTLTTDKP